jgi:hypothetical protein
MDVDARIQLFDLKTKYQFQTVPGVDQYNMPLYNVQSQTLSSPSSPDIGMYPIYQGFTGNPLINGIPVSFETRREDFFGYWFNFVQNMQVVGTGNGTAGPYTLTFPVLSNNIPPPQNPPYNCVLRGHVDITGIIATGINQDPPFGTTLNPLIPSTSIYPAVYITTLDANGNNIVVQDSGQFLLQSGNTMPNYGLLMTPGNAPFGYSALPNGGSLPQAYTTTQNTINYFSGVITNLYFPVPIPGGQNINAQAYFFQTGLPRAMLFYNNVLTLRVPPAIQYLVEIDAYLTPCAFINTAAAIPFAYMAEYLARGAARKILADTGDFEQFQFYEPLFKEQEMLVWKRSQRQFTSTRTPSIYSQGNGNIRMGFGWNSSNGGV